MLHEDRRRASSFGEDAEQYDRARPAYPAELLDHLMSDHPVDILDVGCGTGIAARLFATHGGHVLGVEPDHRMAAVARKRGLAVEEATFEEWDPAGRRFDLVTAAQSWHWVDPARGAAKAVDVLRPGARIGTFWNRGRVPDDLRAALDVAYARVAPELGQGFSVPQEAFDRPDEDCQLAAESFAANGSFEDVATRAFFHSVDYTAAEWVDQLPTHSDHRTLPPDQLHALTAQVAAAIEAFGGRFEMRYVTWLVEARRLGPQPPS